MLILLGASAWPLSPEFQSSEAFANAARRVKAYFLNPQLFGLPEENLLDLFNSEKSADEIDVIIGHFLEDRRGVLQATGNPARDLLVYFIGHGGFVGRDADFYLAIRRTRMDNPRASSLQVMALADTLTERARHLRRTIILDCCFAAAAFSAFQSGPAQVALEKTVDAFEVGQKAIGFPTKGTTLLCSSGHKSPSLILPDESSTMFSKALLDTLVQGTHSSQEHLTLRYVKDVVASHLSAMRNAPKPVVLSPDQSEGDVADIPLFPNPWIEKQRLLKLEEEKRQAEEVRRVEEQKRMAEEERIRQAEAEEKRLREIEEEKRRHIAEEQLRKVEEERRQRENEIRQAREAEQERLHQEIEEEKRGQAQEETQVLQTKEEKLSKVKEVLKAEGTRSAMQVYQKPLTVEDTQAHGQPQVHISGRTMSRRTAIIGIAGIITAGGGIWWGISHNQNIPKLIILGNYSITDGVVNALAWSPAGKHIVSAGGGPPQVWETTNGKNIYTYRGHAGELIGGTTYIEVDGVAWSPDGKRIASGGYDLLIWQAP